MLENQEKAKEYKSKRNGRIIIVDNYIYNFDTRDGNTIRWRCQIRPCKGRVYTDSDLTIKEIREHLHPADRKKADNLINDNRIKERVLSTREDSRTIKNVILESMSVEEKIHSIRPKSMTDKITKCIRSKNPSRDEDRSDIPRSLYQNLRQEDFFLFDSKNEFSSRFVIFMSKFQAENLKKCQIWFIDGTFKSCPRNFYQIVSIHGVIFGKSFPFCFMLLSSKEEANYLNAFIKLKSVINAEPKKIIIDFEKAIINSLKTAFPLSTISGCLFHFSQALFKYLKDTLKMLNIYKNDQNIRKIFRMILNLAFFPSNDVFEEYYNIISHSVEIKVFDKMSLFFEYFERTYIGFMLFDNFNSPTYSLKIWNVFNRIINFEPRTTNYIEGWHSSLNKSVGQKNPDISILGEVLRETENNTHFEILQLEKGEFIHIQKKDIEKEFKLINALKNYKNYTCEAYLEILLKIYKFKLD